MKKSIPGGQCNCYVTEPALETAALCIVNRVSKKAKFVSQDCAPCVSPGPAGPNFAATLTKVRR